MLELVDGAGLSLAIFLCKGSNPFVGIKIKIKLKYNFIFIFMYWIKIVLFGRIAAQIGSASALGVGGYWFESNLSDLWATQWVTILLFLFI